MIKFFKQKNTSGGFTRTLSSKVSGFTLVETLVAISILTSSIVVLMSVLASGVSNTTYAKNKIIAGYLAQEGIEQIRNMRDSAVLKAMNQGDTSNDGWVAFKDNISSLNTPNSNFYASPITGFTRTLQKFDINLPDEIKITSSVSWTPPSGNMVTITFSENLFNWVE